MLRKWRTTVWMSFKGPGGILFCAALLFYLPALWWGLPHATARPRIDPWGADELAPLQSVTELYGVFFARHPNFNPQYPLLQNIMQALLVGPYIVYTWLTGRLHHPEPVYPFGFTDPLTSLQITTILSRIVSWLMAGGVVWIAYETGRVLKDRITGWIAGVFVLCMYPMFYYARTSNVDMGALFWTAAGLLLFAVYLRDGLTPGRAMGIGICAALATATKDASWAAFFMAGLVIARSELSSPPHRTPSEKLRPLLRALLVAAAVYVAASGLLFRPSRYIQHVTRLVGSGIRVHGRPPATLAGYTHFVVELGRGVLDTFGTPLTCLALAGVILCCVHNRRMLAWLLPAIGVVLLVLVPARYVLLRFMLVIGYPLVFFAAFAVREAWERPRWRTAAIAAFAIAAGWAVVRGADLTWQMLRDPRYEVAAWLHRTARPGDRVLHYENPRGLPALDAGVQNIWMKPPRSYEYQHDGHDPEFVVLIPYELFPSDPEHETNLSEEDYRRLRDGSLGYRQVMRLQTARLFQRRPLPFVNPLVQVFEREDLLARESR